jgi:hypothetical protein
MLLLVWATKPAKLLKQLGMEIPVNETKSIYYAYIKVIIKILGGNF